MKVAEPLDRAWIETAPPSMLKLTLPVGVPAAEATVTVAAALGKAAVGELMVVVVGLRTASTVSVPAPAAAL